jgi:hypothetical protein
MIILQLTMKRHEMGRITLKWEGSHFIMHGMFVDDMAHAAASQKMIKRFMKEYSKDFEYTGGGFMTSFLGLEVGLDAALGRVNEGRCTRNSRTQPKEQ